MTAQGEDILAWLDRAISERERVAQTSVEQQAVYLAGSVPSLVSVWHVVERQATEVFVVARDQWDRTAEVVPTYGGGHAEHIALNDPASVLRRCAADRKLLELHGGRGHGCPAYDYDGDLDEFARFYNHEACPVVQHLAEGYGWTAGQTPPIEGDQVT
ncbi:DUF6221 family protein [Streptomyces ardesiacus]|uniref:DUF6221 family protein n=1 Tax=Streptomyces ardesiacus TaxID=285564 RepID=UPI0036C62BD6